MQQETSGGHSGVAVGWAGTIMAFAADALHAFKVFSGFAADLLPIMGLLSATLSVGYMLWKWRRESRNNNQSSKEVV